MIYPSYDLFRHWLQKYNVFPFCSGPVPSKKNRQFEDLYPFFVRYNQSLKNPFPTFFLDSHKAVPDARYSYFPLTAPDREWISKNLEDVPKTWKSLREMFANLRAPSLPSSFPPFYGGVAGFLSYDCGRFFENGIKTSMPPDPLKFPFMHFTLSNDLVCLDHKKKSLFIFSCLNAGDRYDKNPMNLYQKQVKRLNSLVSHFPELDPDLPVGSLSRPIRKRSRDKNGYSSQGSSWFVSSVSKIKKYIAEGDIYQANLSQRIEPNQKSAGEDLFAALRSINPSPYSCFFRAPGHEMVSCSPELLLKKRGRFLETRPIAGTRPRGSNAQSDRKLKGELLLSDKERAEHIMLLDLERNDLGRVCQSGTVRVRRRMTVEKYSHVMHIVSHVTGRLKNTETIFTAIPAVFPGGTITGCPKVRCMEILDEIEPVSRGPFFGSAGWIGYQGDGELNILIRTAVIKEDKGVRKTALQVGSGIVADSVPELEYQESLQKAGALLDALKKTAL